MILNPPDPSPSEDLCRNSESGSDVHSPAQRSSLRPGSVSSHLLQFPRTTVCQAGAQDIRGRTWDSCLPPQVCDIGVQPGLAWHLQHSLGPWAGWTEVLGLIHRWEQGRGRGSAERERTREEVFRQRGV